MKHLKTILYVTVALVAVCACTPSDPLIVRLMYSHPTLSQRIAAIEKRKAEKP